MKIPKLSSHAALLTTFVIFYGVAGAAQEKQTQTPLTGLAVEINMKDRAHGYLSVPGETYGGNYPRLTPWKLTAAAPQPQTIRVSNTMEGNSVRVTVSVFTGRFNEGETLIGSYLLNKGEKAVVEQMVKFGYEPMTIQVIRLNPAQSVVPMAASRVPSVQVINVVERQSNFPSYKLTLRNLSYKDISYLEIRTLKDGAVATIQWPRDDQNRPKLKAGGTYDENVFGGDEGSRTSESYTPSPVQQIEVVAAVFTDKSYEGDRPSALRFIAELQGQKEQLLRSLAFFNGDSGVSDPHSALEKFEAQVSALSREAPPDTAKELSADFENLTPQERDTLKPYFEGGLNDVRKELLKDIQQYAQESERTHLSFRAWRSDLKQKYEAWISRL
jgi:hypothetical protein